MSKMKQNPVSQYFPAVVTWRITSKCNNACPYCYGPDQCVPQMDLLEIEKMLQLFKDRQVKVVDLTGGEPTYRREFPQIVEMLKKHNFDIFMDTDGDFFVKYVDIISQNFKGIGLTIDFPDDTKRYRIVGNLGRVLHILDYYSHTKTRPIIRVATVVTKDNYRLLDQIGKLLIPYSIDIWKLYQFIPQNTLGIKNRLALEIPRSDFNHATKNLAQKFSSHFKVVISKMEDRDSCYFFVGSDGKVFMPVKHGDIFKEVTIGHIFDPDILQKWNQFVSLKNFEQNHEVSKKYQFK